MTLAICTVYGVLMTAASVWVILAPERRAAWFRKARHRVRERQRVEAVEAERQAKQAKLLVESAKRAMPGPLDLLAQAGAEWHRPVDRDVWVNPLLGLEVPNYAVRAAQMGQYQLASNNFGMWLKSQQSMMNQPRSPETNAQLNRYMQQEAIKQHRDFGEVPL